MGPPQGERAPRVGPTREATRDVTEAAVDDIFADIASKSK